MADRDSVHIILIEYCFILLLVKTLKKVTKLALSPLHHAPISYLNSYL